MNFCFLFFVQNDRSLVDNVNYIDGNVVEFL